MHAQSFVKMFGMEWHTKEWTHHRAKTSNDVSNFFVLLSFGFFSFAKEKEHASFYLEASSMATATATVIPTMGLLPAPISPIISVVFALPFDKQNSIVCDAVGIKCHGKKMSLVNHINASFTKVNTFNG